MPWFRVDDSFYDHPKVFDLTDGAVALWLRAGTWSARNLTDGYIPAGMAKQFGTPRAATELVDHGLWSVSKRGGYLFHDWRKYQPTKARVERERVTAKVRMRKLRASRNTQVKPQIVRANFATPDPTPYTSVEASTTGRRPRAVDNPRSKISSNGSGAATPQPPPVAEAVRRALNPPQR